MIQSVVENADKWIKNNLAKHYATSLYGVERKVRGRNDHHL